MNRAEKRRQQKTAKKAARKSPNKHSIDSHQALRVAIQYHSAGRLSDAEKVYQQILQADPNQPDALHFLGVIAHQVSNYDSAVGLIKKAIDIKPDYAEAHYNLGNTLKALGKLDEAVVSYNKAIAIKPDFAVAHYNLGAALQTLGKLDEAVACYNNALSIKPDYVETHYNLGNTLLSLGKLDEAIDSYNTAISLKPDYAEAHFNLGNALKTHGKLDEAIANYNIALAIKPDYAEAYNNRGNALKALDKLEEAIDSYNKALANNPDYAEAHNNLGNAFTNLGKIDEAVANFSKAIAIKPDFAEAHRHMANAKNYSEYDEDIRSMEKNYNNLEINDEQRMHLAFGLGKAFEDLQQYEKAFDYFFEGNALIRKADRYSIEEDIVFFNKIRETLNASFFAAHQQTGYVGETPPIFILGMPRSGTSLVEQILASHPRVYGAGELETFGNIIFGYFQNREGVEFPNTISLADRDDFARAGIEYTQGARKTSQVNQFVTDKMPNNFKFIGLIKLILPDAKVIHCQRDPADTCLSLFKNYFLKQHKYSHDLKELGQYYNLYKDLMEHWHKVLPGFIHDVQYEDMIGDQAQQTRALLDFCGLEWDDACLDFHKSDRPVATASAAQVRRPIYNSSVQLWKKYEKQLAPLLETL